MPENVHIPLGKVQAAYDLNDEELYDLIQKLWEHKQLFYNELWAETYEKYWHFAATGSLPHTQEKLPELPELDSRHQSNFYPIFYGAQMVGYLAQLIKLVSYKPSKWGWSTSLKRPLRMAKMLLPKSATSSTNISSIRNSTVSRPGKIITGISKLATPIS